jgi:hypothetical protein
MSQGEQEEQSSWSGADLRADLLELRGREEEEEEEEKEEEEKEEEEDT